MVCGCMSWWVISVLSSFPFGVGGLLSLATLSAIVGGGLLAVILLLTGLIVGGLLHGGGLLYGCFHARACGGSLGHYEH